MNRKKDGHTILFLQPTDEESRTYTDYNSVENALFGMCELFEETFKEKYQEEILDYEITDVIAYFSNFQEILMMIYDEDFANYVPRDDDWIIRKLNDFGHTTGQADGQVSASGKLMDLIKNEITEDDWENLEVML
jgi:hypothetical protein